MKFNLKRLILLNNLVTALLPIVCIGLISIAVVRHRVVAEHDRNSALLASSISGQINTYLSAPVGTFKLLSNHLQMHDNSSSERSDLLALLVESYAYFDAIYLLDGQGTVQQAGLKSNQLKAVDDYLGMDFSGIDICRNAREQKRLFTAASVSIASGEPTMSFCAPLGSGTILADLKLSDLGRVINLASEARTFTAFILDKSGLVIAHPDQEVVRRKENAANLPFFRDAAAGRAATADFSMHGRDYRGTAMLIPEPGWVLVVAQEISVAMAPVNALQQILLTGMVMTMLLALALGFIGSRMLRRPFEQLTGIAQRVIREDYHSVSSVPSNCEEIRILSDTLCRMVDAISAREIALNEQTEELMTTEETLRELNMLLEEKVAERTARLEGFTEELAVLNCDLLQRSNALEEANRQLEAFAYTVSHDLRAPLRHAGSYAAILLETHGDSLPQDGVELAQRIVASCAQMGQLIDALLQFSRVTLCPINRTLVHPENLVREVLADLEEELAGRKHEIKVQPLSDCQADVTLLRQVWANLLGNAVKYTNKRADTCIEVGATSSDNGTVYYVRDNGAGFDMADYDRLFGVFQRLHSAREFAGSGVGLAIVENIIRRHGGRIWAEATVGGGATFSFTLPPVGTPARETPC